MALSIKAVRVFAAVEVLRDNQKDVRHALATLFEPDIAKFNGQVFDPARIAAEINEQYKLGLNADVITGFVEIFIERGWLEKILETQRVAYIVKCPLFTEIPEELRSFSERAKELANEFRVFVERISPLSQVRKTDEELIDDLVDWLMRLDRVTEGSLKTASQRYKIGTKIVVDFQDSNEPGFPSESTFLSARFVEHLFYSNSPHIPFLIELGEVGLITEVVRDFQRPTTAVKKTDLSVYLDAPLALDYLGLSGVEAQGSIALVLSGLTSLGGHVRIFGQSVNEMQTNLSAMLNRPVPERTGPTADALRRREVLEAYVREVASNPRKFLELKGVAVVEQNADAFPSQHKYFSQHAIDLLYSQIGWVREDVARAHDAEIAAFAMRRRAGSNSNDVFKCKHVVLTRNPTFTKLTRRIAREQLYIGPDHVGPVIHQQQMATAIWLRAGARSDSEIPRRHIMSSCRRVLTLRKNIVEKVHQLKAHLTEAQAEQLELLLTVDRSAQVLMDKTLGSASIIDSSNISILVEEMKKAQIADHIAESTATIQKLESAAKAREAALANEALRQQEAMIAQIENAAREAEFHNVEAESRRQELERVWNSAISSVNVKIERRRTAAIVGAVILFSAVTTVAYFGGGQQPPIAVGGLVFVVIVGSFFQFRSKLKERILRSLLQDRDWVTLEKVIDQFGLDTEQVEGRLIYCDGKFSLSPRG
jgi:hypothetical protein